MSKEEARQLGFALVAIIMVMVVIGIGISFYFYSPSEGGVGRGAIESKKQAEDLSKQINGRNQAQLESYGQIASTSY